MDTKKILKHIAVLILPLLIFAVLLIPYSILNQLVLVDRLGCGCPTMDENGNMVSPAFNANDFTALFWSVVALCATGLSVFLSRRIPKERLWGRIGYVAGVLAVSVLLAYLLTQLMMWN